jgi:putative transposase
MYLTRKKKLGQRPEIDRLRRRAGNLWSRITARYWRTVRKKGIWLSRYSMQRWMCKGFSGLHSQTAQAVNHAFFDALASWRANREQTDARPPHKQKGHFKLVYRQSAVRIKDGRLRLSNGRGEDPLWIDWPYRKPHEVEIVFDGCEHVLCAKYKAEPCAEAKGDKVAGVDLGEIHLAVAYDGEDTIIMNGRKLRALRQYQNRIKACLSAKIDCKRRGSNRWKKLVQSKNKQLSKLRNQITDLLHKMSTRLVEALHERGVSTIALGDVRQIRSDLNYGSTVNQKLHQWTFGKLRHMIEYKAQLRGMTVELVGEAYTSQTCSQCKRRKKPNGRNYCCLECGFEAHRDQVGAANIRAKYLGEGDLSSTPVIGTMAFPIGVRYKPHMRCSSISSGKTPHMEQLR